MARRCRTANIPGGVVFQPLIAERIAVPPLWPPRWTSLLNIPRSPYLTRQRCRCDRRCDRFRCRRSIRIR